MASSDEEGNRIAAAADADLTSDPLIDGELEQEINSDFIPNPDFPTSSKQLKKEKPESDREENKHEWQDNIKSTLVFSGMVVAVVGAIFAVLKKINEA